MKLRVDGVEEDDEDHGLAERGASLRRGPMRAPPRSRARGAGRECSTRGPNRSETAWTVCGGSPDRACDARRGETSGTGSTGDARTSGRPRARASSRSRSRRAPGRGLRALTRGPSPATHRGRVGTEYAIPDELDHPEVLGRVAVVEEVEVTPRVEPPEPPEPRATE